MPGDRPTTLRRAASRGPPGGQTGAARCDATRWAGRPAHDGLPPCDVRAAGRPGEARRTIGSRRDGDVAWRHRGRPWVAKASRGGASRGGRLAERCRGELVTVRAKATAELRQVVRAHDAVGEAVTGAHDEGARPGRSARVEGRQRGCPRARATGPAPAPRSVPPAPPPRPGGRRSPRAPAVPCRQW